MKTGIELITEERERQVSEENWSSEHDDRHNNSDLALAAICYAAPGKLLAPDVIFDGTDDVDVWRDPWPRSWWDFDKRHKHDRIRSLTIAGALIAAEIDRLQRATKKARE